MESGREQMSTQDQIDQISALRDKAVAKAERHRAAALDAERQAEKYSAAIDVLNEIAPPQDERVTIVQPKNVKFLGGGIPSTDGPTGPIYQRILSLLQSDDKLWWTANEIQDGLANIGDVIKMTSISPNLSRLKESGDIVRDDLKVALADRVTQKIEASEDSSFPEVPSEASVDTRPYQSSEPPAKDREAGSGGGT